MKKFARKTALVLLVLAALLAAGLGICRWLGKKNLADWRAALAARGEKFNVTELVPLQTNQPNDSLSKLVLAANRLNARVVDPGSISPLNIVQPGHAQIVWQEREIVTASGSGTNQWSATNRWADFTRQMAEAEEPLSEIRSALAEPAHDLGWDYRDITKSPDGSPVEKRRAAQWLWGATLDGLQRGDLGAATTNLHALLSLTHLPDEAWTLNIQSIRVHIAGLALGATWQALQAPGWTEERLAALQKEWERVQLLEPFERTLQVERAQRLTFYGQLRQTSPQPVNARSPGGTATGFFPTNAPGNAIREACTEVFNQYVYTPTWQVAWSEQDELFYLQNVQPVLEAIRVGVTRHVWPEMKAILQTAPARHDSPTKFYYRYCCPWSQFLLGNWDKTLETVARTETLKQMAITAIALKRYQLKHAQLPPDLTALAPDYVSRPPVDFMDGQPLRYRPKPEGAFTLYSVGLDGKDDGGDPLPATIWEWRNDLWVGRDVLWPLPVTPETASPAASTRTQIVFDNVRLIEVLKILTEQMGWSLQIENNLLAAQTKSANRVDLRMEKATPVEALEAVAQKYNLRFIRIPNTRTAGIAHREK